MRDPSLRRIVDRLHCLRRKIYRCGEDGRKYRVEFLCLAFKHGLDAVSYTHLDVYKRQG